MDQKLDPKVLQQIKQCSKDEASFSKLEEICEELHGRYRGVEKQLSLVEQAIKHDYDSILITELDLEEPGPKIVYVNEGFTRMTGYTKEEVIGKTPRILQGEKTDRKVLDRLKKRLIEGQAFFGHTVNYKKDGTEFVNQWDIHPLTDSMGKITHWVSYQRDITDRKESSKLVFDSSLDFDNLIEESKKTFIDLDVQGNIMSANSGFKNTIGYDADELKSVKIWDLMHTDHQDEAGSLFSDFEAKEIDDRPYLWTFIQKNGNPVELEAHVNYFISNDDTVIRIEFDNITLRNRIIETLNKKKSLFQNLVGKKEEFTLRFVRKEDETITCKFASDNFVHITGFEVDVLLQGGMQEVVHAECLTKIEDALEKAFSGERSSIKCKYNTKEGNLVSVLQSFKPIYNKSNEQIESVKSVALVELSAQE